MESTWYSIQFKNYRGYDSGTIEGKEFINTFEVPEICQKNNLLECSGDVHDKYFKNNIQKKTVKRK